MAKKSRKTAKSKSVTGPKPVAPKKSETERKLEELARKAKLAAKAKSAQIAKTAETASKAGTAGTAKIAGIPEKFAKKSTKESRKSKSQKTSHEIIKAKKRLAKGNRRLSNDFEAWVSANPELAARTKKLPMAIKPGERMKRLAKAPISLRIRDILAGKRVQAALDVKRAAEKARQALTGDLKGIRRVAKVLATTAKTAVARAKEALIGVTARVFKGIAAGRLFDKPVEDIRKRFDPRVAKQTPEGQSMIGVSSSNVFSVGFEPDENDPNTGTMFIQFRSGWSYKYKDAPRWLYEGLLSATSPGRYVWANLRRGLYPDGTPYGNFESDGYTRIR